MLGTCLKRQSTLSETRNYQEVHELDGGADLHEYWVDSEYRRFDPEGRYPRVPNKFDQYQDIATVDCDFSIQD